MRSGFFPLDWKLLGTSTIDLFSSFPIVSFLCWDVVECEIQTFFSKKDRIYFKDSSEKVQNISNIIKKSSRYMGHRMTSAVVRTSHRSAALSALVHMPLRTSAFDFAVVVVDILNQSKELTPNLVVAYAWRETLTSSPRVAGRNLHRSFV